MSANRLIDFCRGIEKVSTNLNVIEKIKKIFKKYDSRVTDAKLIKVSSGSYKIRVNWKQIDFNELESVNFFKEYRVNLKIDGNVDNVVAEDFFHGVSDEVTTRDNQFKAVIRDKKSKDGKSSQLLEFWSTKGLLKVIDGEKEKLFGKILTSIGKMQWSADGSQLVFIANKYYKKSGFFEDEKKGDDSKESDESCKGNEYILRNDWGEQLEGTFDPIVCVVDRNDDFKVRTIQVPNISCTETFWIDNKTVGFVGLLEESRRLGLIFCPIRKSHLYKCDLRDPESEPVCIYGDKFNVAIRSPRVSKDFKKLAFLSNPPSGPHFQASSLIVLNLQNNIATELITTDSLRLNQIEDPSEIKTLYCHELPKDCWMSNDKNIMIEATIGYRTHLFLINYETREHIRIRIPGKTVQVLSSLDDLIVVKISEPNLGNNLQIGRLIDNQLNLVPVDTDSSFQVDDVAYECDTLEKIDPSTNEKQIITSILLSPKELLGKPSATILWPHGGPCDAYIAEFNSFVSSHVEMGFKVILVNYRGSTGINSSHEKFLCGKVGKTDVEDCMEVLKYYINKSETDPKEVFLSGGSHGGFLVTHLIGQYSDFGFKACATRNPVTDLSQGFSTTDIPDWHMVVGMGLLDEYPLTTIPTCDMLTELLKKSPIYHINKVKTPVLMCLGTKDQRVVMHQGKYYFYALQALKVESKCIVYEDNHSLGKVPHTCDYKMNTCLWFLDHLKSITN